MESLAADKRCTSGTAHSLIIDRSDTTYVFKDIKTLTKRKGSSFYTKLDGDLTPVL